MKNWMANKVEDWLDNKGYYGLATKWQGCVASRQWYQPNIQGI